jgi:outer membrane protein TolC
LTTPAAGLAQLSFTSAIDLALKNSPKIKVAEADVARAKASHEETRDAFIPSFTPSAGLGKSWGFPLGLPAVFNFSTQSLIYSKAENDYLRASNAGLLSSKIALDDARQQVAEDAATAYVALDSAERRHAALVEEAGFAARLLGIVQDRFDAGQDAAMEVTRARRTVLQLRLQRLLLEDEIASYRDHLSRLIGLPGITLTTVPGSIPALPALSASSPETPTSEATDSTAVQAAFASARSKYLQARGDAHAAWLPQVSFQAYYARINTTLGNRYSIYYPSVVGLTENAEGIDGNVTIPVLDFARRAKARESAAEAAHAQFEALSARDSAREAQLKLQHSLNELAVKAELAGLDRDLAEQEIDVIQVRLQSAPAAGTPAITPKDEQNARIHERQLYIDLLEDEETLRETQINLLRQTGKLEEWITLGLVGTAPAVARPQDQ